MGRVLLLAALPVEVDALSELVDNAIDVDIAQSYCRRGVMAVGHGELEVTVAEVGVGSIDSALNTVSIVDVVRPELVLFVGVAGGVKDVDIGDVVVADKVHFYESGRDEKEAFRARPISPWVSRGVQSIGRRLRHEGGADFRIAFGAIAAGEKVVASTSSRTADTIRQHYGDALAVEMEGAGFVAAMHRFPDCEFGVVRGISDLLDGKEVSDREGTQGRAADNAAFVARRIVEELVAAGTLHTSKRNRTKLNYLASAIPRPSPTQSYVLVASRGSQVSLAVLRAGTPCGLVLDLDPYTDTDGLHKAVSHEVSTRRLVRLETPLDHPRHSRHSLTWLAVNGLSGRIEPSDLPQWNRRHRRQVRRVVEDFATANGGRHLTVLIAQDGDADRNWLAALSDDLVTEFGDACSLIALRPDSSLHSALQVDGEIRLEADDLEETLRAYLQPALPSDKAVQLPSGAGEVVSLDPVDLAWLSEETEIVPLSTWGEKHSESAELDFLRGGEIHWAALQGNADVVRDKYSDLRKTVGGALRNRRTLRINLFHEPGAGGTTVARRCAYDFHADYPTVLVHSISPQETARRIDWVARHTELPVLAIVDSSFLNEGAVSALMNDLQAAHTSVVLVQVGRRFTPPSESSSSVFLRAFLSDGEAEDLYDRYLSQAPDSYLALNEARQCRDERRNAFYFGLAAFESDFRGLDGFVASRLTALTEPQSRAVLFAAMAHYYGQAGLPEHAIGWLIGLPASRADSISSILHPEARSLLWRSDDGVWRTLHQLVAREVLVRLGGPRWRSSLSAWGIEFAEFCRGTGTPAEEMRRIVQAVFFDRGSQELLGTEAGSRNDFSRLVEDIPADSGAARLLSEVAALFPDDAHFAGHVARFYAFRVGNYKRAAIHARRAVELLPNDARIHHMLGMVFRAEAYDAMGRREALDVVEEWGQQASEEFASCRQLDPYDAHGYISDVQLFLRVVGYAVRGSGSLAEYLRTNPDPYVIECLESAEDLLARVKGLGDPSRSSGYERRSLTELKSLYGDYATALQMLDSLLARRDIDPLPVRRQLVWTHLERAGRDWRALDPKSTARVIDLLEMNLREGRYASKDARQWWRAVRYAARPPSQDRVFEVLAYWRENGGGLEAAYCSYVAFLTDVLDGIPTALPEANRYMAECINAARGRQDRTNIVDWVGNGQGVSKLVHVSELGGWDKDADFWRDTSRLRRVSGRIGEIRGPQAGHVEISGIRAFFVPGRSNLERGRDDNRLVTGFLGFSHDGPRLWEVELEDADSN